MTRLDTRTNWLSEIIEEKRQVSNRPVPFFERKAERDAIVMAIRAHPQGQRLATIPELADVVWEALGVAHTQELENRDNAHLALPTPAVKASLFIFEAESPNRV